MQRNIQNTEGGLFWQRYNVITKWPLKMMRGLCVLVCLSVMKIKQKLGKFGLIIEEPLKMLLTGLGVSEGSSEACIAIVLNMIGAVP